MIRKFFPKDKNYVLESVQLNREAELLEYLVDYVRVAYLLRHNPLGIQDNLTQKIQSSKVASYDSLHEFYLTLMGVFRYLHYEDNQLTFDFDGAEPAEKYVDQWMTQFRRWTRTFCEYDSFMRVVLDFTVMYGENSPVILMDTRLQTFIAKYFSLTIHPQKGITRQHVA